MIDIDASLITAHLETRIILPEPTNVGSIYTHYLRIWITDLLVPVKA